MITRALRPYGLFAVCILFSCSSTETPPAPTSPTVHFVDAAAVPDFMDVPFPSDAYLANGKIGTIPALDAVVTVNASFLQKALSTLDGFSRTAAAEFYVDDPTSTADEPVSAKVDPATLPVNEAACLADQSSVFFLDLEQTDPAKARIGCRAAYHVASLAKTRPALGVGPARGVVLLEGHRYAAVVTSRVKDKDGHALAASPDFQKIASGDRSGPVGAMYGDAYDKVSALLSGALAADGAQIVGVAAYTTDHSTRELFALRDALEDAPTPALKWDTASLAPMGDGRFAAATPLPAGFAATLDDWLGVVDAKDKLPSGDDDPDRSLPVRAHDKIAAVGTAVFDAVNYLQVRPNGYADPDHANFARDASGNVIPAPEKPTSKIWVTIALPTAAMPPDGYPVVIVQHGLSSSRSFLFDLANIFCAKGWAAVAIDSVTFGARAPEPQYQNDKTTNYVSAPGAKYNGPDGIADVDDKGATNGSFDLFGGLQNLGALRDQLRQAELDTAQLVKVLRAGPDISPLQTGGTAPKLDGSRIVYVGDSLGAIEGTVAAALEPHVLAWALNVDGGGIINELGVHSPAISAQLSLAGALNFGFQNDQFTDTHPLVTLIQTIVGPGDPIDYASRLVTDPAPLKGVATKPRDILQTEVVFDEIVSNEAGEALARAAGLPMASPNVGSNAEIMDLKAPDQNPHRIDFPQAAPDSGGAIHDTPLAGTTAVLVQLSPGTHGEDIANSHGTRQYRAPWGQFDTDQQPFFRFDTAQQYQVRCSYRETQAGVTGFFDGAFAGKVPQIAGFAAPVRDLDDDGTPDATDPDPNDPSVK